MRLLAITLGVALAGLGTIALAARDSAGTYSRPSGNPVTTGTPIASTWANTLTGDLATELTDSLSRSGKGGMTAPLRCADGTASLPAFSWTSDTNTGFYRIGADNIGLSLGGTKRWDFGTAGTVLTGTFDVSGATTVASLDVEGATSLAGALAVHGAATFADPVTLMDALTVTSTATFSFDATFTGSVTVPTPTAAGHAVTKAYVDASTNVAMKTATQTDATGSYADVTDLAFAVEAGKTYEYEFVLRTLSAVNTTALYLKITGPASPTEHTAQRYWWNSNTLPDAIYTEASDSMPAAFDHATGHPAAGLETIDRITGILVNGVNAGTVQLQFRTEVAASQVSIGVGSFVRWRKLN
jgi:hypothetical protein